ncbi:MAG TPA: YceI family protein [Opitutaceae bacterium]|nr:YceI family protein [Opitutaceae bacterium]
MKTHHLTVTLIAAALAAAVNAAPINFDFKDPKGVNNIVFLLDAPLESINGTATGISGSASFDPENPAAVSGTISLDVTTLRVPNNMMQDHLAGERWMDAGKFPAVTFEVTGASNARTVGETTEADLAGNLTVKGVTHSISVPAKLTFLKGKLKARGGSKVDGDLLVVRSSFAIKRSDYGINAGQMLDKVSDDILLTMSIVGIAPYAE